MEVMIPPSPADFNFNFDSASTSPFISAPGSPQPFGNPLFFSAPTSPTRISAFYRDFEDFYAAAAADGCDSPSSIPFKWEERPGIPKKRRDFNDTTTIIDDDFEFDFSGHLETASVSAADELFDGGKIKPLKLPPRLHSNEWVITDSPKSPIRKNIFIDAISPKQRNRDSSDPFAAAIEETRKIQPENQETGRGRPEKKSSSSSSTSSSSSNNRRKGTRSLSPFRVFDIFSDQEDSAAADPTTKEQEQEQPTSLISKWGWKGWKLKDLFLFRSASEGRGTYKSPMMKKYELMKKAAEEDVKNSSFRSTESSGSVRGRRRGPPASAHEIHYTVNRAVSEELKRRTSLPYRHGLMGCLGFNPVLRDQISRRFESLTRGRS